MTKKTILGQGAWYLVYGAGERTYIATTFTFDDANQLVSSTTDGVTTFYAYDAAGRLVTEGNKTYRYGYLDKVLSVTDGDTKRTFTYHADGQLATANNERADANRSTVGRGDPTAPQSETFLWDGLALIRRNDEHFINEPHVGGGNPVASSKGKSYFNDILGTTVGFKTNGKYSPAALSAFGERLDNADGTFPAIRSLGEGWFTGKPYVEGLGHAFLMRNYRASLGKWQTADPLGYPDGWNQLAYCNNGVLLKLDMFGGAEYDPQGLTISELTQLATAIDTWLEAANGALYGLAGWVVGRPYTLSFLTRYMNSLGNQSLAYKVISQQSAINNANNRAITAIRSGLDRYTDRVMKGGWTDFDFETSLGAVVISYNVTRKEPEGIYVKATIDDTYDFHDQATVDFPLLDYFACDWGGGNKIYDKWMQQLAIAEFAQEFKTHIEWTLFIPE